MPESFKEVCENIKACLNSSKRQMALNELNRDYEAVLGEKIPFKALGYSTLEKLIYAVPDVKISRISSELFISVKANEKTAHIANLVRGQKPAKTKKSKGSRFERSYRAGPPPRYLRSSVSRPHNSYFHNSDTKSYGYNGTRTYRDNVGHYNRDNSKTRYNDNSQTRYRDDSLKTRYRDENSKTRYHDNSNTQYYNSGDVIFQKYRSSKPSELDFSENESDELSHDLEFDDVNVSQSKNESSIVDLTNDVNDLHITNSAGGTSRTVHIIDRNLKLAKNRSVDEDKGYVSMNDVNSPLHEKLPTKESSAVGKNATDVPSRKILSTKRGPAAIAAAGKKLINISSTDNEQITSNSVDFAQSNNVDNLLYGRLPNSTRRTVIAGFAPKNDIGANTLMSNETVPAMSSPVDVPPSASYLSSESLPTTFSNDLYPLTSSAPSSMTIFPTNAPQPSNLPPSQQNRPIMSKMSDANMFKPGPNLMPDISKDSMCHKLLKFTEKLSLPSPIYCNFNKYDPRTNAVSFMCKIKIGNETYSYPYENSVLRNVHEEVARRAYNDLRAKFENIDVLALSVSHDRALIISRVGEIVHSFPNGLKSSKIEEDYKRIHREILPVNWLDIIKELSLLSVEELVGGMYVYPAPEGIHSVTTLPPLILPENNQWDVFVTCCVSSSNFSFRIINEEYNGRFEEMAEMMEEMYASLREKDQLRSVEMVKEANFYAACLDNRWFRVKALANSTINQDNVKVSLIDHGDIDQIPKDCIFPLNEVLTSLPPQAVRAGLSDLESYCNDPYVTSLLMEELIDKSLVAKVDSRNPRLLLTLYDTSTSEDINVNKSIGEHIEKHLTPPKLPKKDGLIDVHLVSVTEEGIAFVQILTEAFKFLKSLLDAANAMLSEDQQKYVIKSTNELFGGMFLAKYAVDDRWHRAIVQKCESEDKVEVLFCDYGNTEIVTIKDIVDAQHFHPALSVIPTQAVEVRLMKPTNELFTQTIIQFLMEIAYSTNKNESPQIFVMKVVNEKEIPDVELYTRLNDSNKLLSISDIIGSYYPEYRGPNFSGVKISSVNSLISRNKHARIKKESIATTEKLHPIKSYQFPNGIPFYVYVHMVANPSHFVIQPDEYRSKLQSMMIEMNKFYSNEQPIVSIDDLKVGQAYAIKRDTDNLWCRGVVLCIMDDTNSISVKLIDYGDIISVKYSQILQLLPCFRVLPSLAIKAELAGIEPIQGDWNFQDCIRFKELVGNKVLVAHLVEIKNDKVGLVLVDRYDETKFIGSILAQEGRAIDKYACV